MYSVRKALSFALIVAVALMALPAAPAQAAFTPVISAFHATCSTFSVAFSLTGKTNDANGYDRVRFEVTDGTGKLLYREDSVRVVNPTMPTDARVTGLSYDADGVADGAPVANPIRFTILDTDVLQRPVGKIAEATFESACLGQTSKAAYFASLLPTGELATLKAATALYPTPGGSPLALTVEGGRTFTAIYRSNDNGWIGIYVGGENLVWIPADAATVNLSGLRILPTRIDPSQQATGAIVPTVPVATARALYTVNMRQLPATTSKILAKVRYQETVAVYGRSANSAWLLITYNGVSGWVASRFMRLNETRLSALPVVG